VAQAAGDLGPDEILEIQESLATLGFDAGPADGVLGQQTRAAIAEAQRQLGWEADGEPSSQLLVVLRRALAARDRAAAVPETTGTDEPETAPETQAEATDDTAAAQAPVPAAVPTTAVEIEPVAQASETAAATSSGPAYPIAGSKWTFADSTGANFTAVLRPDGTIRGPVLSGDWTWRAEGSAIAIEYNSGIGHWVRRQGALQGGNAMQGTGQSSLGSSWTWNATRSP
jgi:peptidoglycan hydrolase-like protein with peptidoglycan-binding domain